METKSFKIDSAKSSIEWVGKKVTGAHNGTVNIADGLLTFNDGKLTGGKFTIDTTSIRILDITDLNTNAQFAGHLASEDFFGIEQYPTATLEITSVSQESDGIYHVAGNLTIKGISHPIEFDAEVGGIDGDTLQASAKLIVDRTKYGMRFRSGNFFKDLGDTLIFNDFTLHVLVTAKAA
ncbi:YceI family protein [Flavitalea sp. BT771]|uniref:YceI family protein n=1 Tax=Flavitalea sp. BT771 TaxID=3063329 RepID=UPI0026E2A63A|nr:YceI family protein [Flavitalea sp. BT771]MDO6429577.1 YceI family protein [Flavitalea sp. BT771]MDV6218295.1 YceI family protein [Flavitalea sp. BT771]